MILGQGFVLGLLYLHWIHGRGVKLIIPQIIHGLKITMNNQHLSLISLLGIIATVSIIAAVAQENNTALNNISQKNGTLCNTSINLTGMNKSISETNSSELNSSAIAAFKITSNPGDRPKKGIGYDVSAEGPGIQSPEKAAFLICGYTRPTKNATYEDLSLLNAAYLSRGVEGTPHGYVTYHN